MSLVELNNGLKFGNIDVDSEMAELLSRINLLHDAIQHKEHSSDIEMIAEFFEDYVENHFKDEEVIMKEKNYSGFAEHKKEHDFFKEEFTKIRKSLRENDGKEIWDGLEEMEILLRDWMLYHITSVDRKLEIFLKEAV